MPRVHSWPLGTTTFFDKPQGTWIRRMAAAYILIATVWILGTDRLLTLIPEEHLATAQTTKGLFFVVLTVAFGVLITQRALAAGHRLVEPLLASAPLAIVAVDLQGRVRLWNREAERMFGWKPEEVIGWPNPIVPPDRVAELEQHVRDAAAGDPCDRELTRRRRKDGQDVLVELTTAPIRDPCGRVVGAVALLVDAARQHESEMQMQLQAAALEATASAVVLADAEMRVLWTNRAFRKLAGYTSAEAVGAPLPELLWGGAHRSEGERLASAIAAGEPFRHRGVHRRKSGSSFIAELTVSPIRGEHGRVTHLVAVQEDVSEMMYLAEQLRFHLSYDKLTQLPNRTLFLEKVSGLAADERTRQELAFVVARIHRIHRVRQSLGRAAADELVKTVAERLLKAAGGLELASLGGGLFALAWAAPRVEPELPHLLQRLRSAVERPTTLAGSEFHPRVVIGSAILPRDGATAELVLQRAETALSRAFEQGSPVLHFEDALQTSIDERLALASELPAALERPELFLEYQPIFDLQEGSIAFAEALVRWDHPRHGTLGPGRFLPAAEEAGLSLQIDQWVLRRAVCDWRAGLAERAGAVTVNLHVQTLEDDGLVTHLHELAKAARLARGEVILEITEGSAMRAPERTITVLERLVALGFGIAIDDFGVAYSSLNYLRRFPAHFLKIDRSFISGLGAMRRDERLVEAVLGLAEDYGMQVIAEGVEEQHQLVWLQRRDCRYVQGYLLARPSRADELPTTVPTAIQARGPRTLDTPVA